MAETWAHPLSQLQRIFSPARRNSAALRFDSSDEELFARVCRSDDHAAFNEILTRYRVRLTALVRRMLSPAQLAVDPDDVAQEAFIEAYHKRGTFRPGATLRPWLYSIAVNRCLNQLRGLHPEFSLEYEEAGVEARHSATAAVNDPESILIQRSDIAEIEQAASLLPPKLRAVLILRYLDDMSYEEIAETCRLPVGTVKTQLFRARVELKRRLINREQSL